ncbi:MAG: hypothetical protein AAGG80_06585, partial [Pseudomonadota bacterium]
PRKAKQGYKIPKKVGLLLGFFGCFSAILGPMLFVDKHFKNKIAAFVSGLVFGALPTFIGKASASSQFYVPQKTLEWLILIFILGPAPFASFAMAKTSGEALATTIADWGVNLSEADIKTIGIIIGSINVPSAIAYAWGGSLKLKTTVNSLYERVKRYFLKKYIKNSQNPIKDAIQTNYTLTSEGREEIFQTHYNNNVIYSPNSQTTELNPPLYAISESILYTRSKNLYRKIQALTIILAILAFSLALLPAICFDLGRTIVTYETAREFNLNLYTSIYLAIHSNLSVYLLVTFYVLTFFMEGYKNYFNTDSIGLLPILAFFVLANPLLSYVKIHDYLEKNDLTQSAVLSISIINTVLGFIGAGCYAIKSINDIIFQPLKAKLSAPANSLRNSISQCFYGNPPASNAEGLLIQQEEHLKVEAYTN